jgi:hypothetical protein
VFVQECEVTAFLTRAAPKQLHGESGTLRLEVSPRHTENVSGGRKLNDFSLRDFR